MKAFIRSFIGIVAALAVMAGIAFAGGLLADAPSRSLMWPSNGYLQWKLNDNASNTTVAGNYLNATLSGGNTSAVTATLNGKPAFRLNNGTSGQYVTASLWTIPITPVERARLWTKSASNPVIGGVSGVMFGQLCHNPSGGWYWYGAISSGAYIGRWYSTDLINWTGPTTVLSGGGAGAWDQYLQVATVFQDPLHGNQWIMLYRGYNGTTYATGIAYSSDGTTFTRGGTGGTGAFPQFGSNYDPVGVILVGTRYYVYLNGASGHQISYVYYSDDDFNTFTSYSGNPIFTQYFCGSVFTYGGYYYMLIPRDINQSGTNLYDHAIALFRSPNPYFDKYNRQYLGCVIVNDQTYDSRYLDTPSVPTSDVYRGLATDFGSTLNVIYTGASICSQNLASAPTSDLINRPQLNEVDASYFGFVDTSSYSFWVQFDTLGNLYPVFSVGQTSTSSNPDVLAVTRTSGSNTVLSMYLGANYRNTSLALATGTLYHVVLVNNGSTNHIVYINGQNVGTFAYNNTNLVATYLYIGVGYGGQYLHGYVQDFRMYPVALSQVQVSAIYRAGPQ